jgi:DNA invertase Pin-like site-specific DNA recombinase
MLRSPRLRRPTQRSIEGASVIYGYARVSSQEQDHSIQEATLLKAGCSVVRAEKVSGTKLEGRTELDLLLQFMRPGDTLMVTRVDRLARCRP